MTQQCSLNKNGLHEMSRTMDLEGNHIESTRQKDRA